jgi:hypothetical protein
MESRLVPLSPQCVSLGRLECLLNRTERYGAGLSRPVRKFVEPPRKAGSSVRVRPQAPVQGLFLTHAERDWDTIYSVVATVEALPAAIVMPVTSTNKANVPTPAKPRAATAEPNELIMARMFPTTASSASHIV